MNMNRMQTYKSVFLMVLTVLFLGCLFYDNGSYCLEQGAEKAVCDASHQEQLSSAGSFFRIEMASCMSRSTNRFNFHFNSLMAVLLKIAVIPSSNIIIVVIMAEIEVLQALWRILCFVHDSDGKKEIWVLQVSI